MDCLLEVDGGINPLTASLAVASGAQVLVAGSDVFHAPDRKEQIDLLRGSGKNGADQEGDGTQLPKRI